MSRYSLILAFLQLLLVPAAFAVDGVIEINQASVDAAGGFPFSISDSGSYRLTSNLDVPASTDGLTTTADDVRIDFNGFALIGPGSCTANIDGGGKLTGVACSGTTGVGVEGVTGLSNGTIRGFATAVEGVSNRAIELDRMVLTENFNGVDCATAESFRMTDSRISVHGGPGVDTFSLAGTAVIRDSIFERNDDRGINLSAGLVSHSSFHQNGGEGIRANIGRGVLVENSYFEDNAWGIYGGINVGYRGNVFHDNTTNVNVNPENLGANLCGAALCP